MRQSSHLRTSVTLAIVAVLVLVISFAGLATPGAQARRKLTVEWITQFGTGANDEATAVSVERSGIYGTGYTSAAFPGQTRHHRPDVFVQRYDESGGTIWTDQFGTDVYDYAYAIDASPSGIYVAGGSNGTLPGAKNHREFDAFVRAYDSGGTPIWTREFGGPTDDYAYGVAADGTGVYVVGYTHGTLPGERGLGHADAFIRKYEPDGRVAWTHQFGTDGQDEALSVAVGASGVYVAGYVGGSLPGASASGRFDAFVRRYTQSGRETWTGQFGTSSDDEALGITLGAKGVFLVGSTSGRLSNEQIGGTDAFVQKYRVNGHLVWTRQFGTEGEDVATGVSVAHGAVDVSGRTDGSFSGQVNPGGEDAFLRVFDVSGRTLSGLLLGSSSDDQATGVGARHLAIFIVGVTEGTLAGATSVGKEDAFLARIDAS